MRSFLAGLRRLVIPWGATADQPRVVIATDDPLARAFSDAGMSFYYDAGHGFVIAVDNFAGMGIFRIAAGPADAGFTDRMEVLHAEYDQGEPLTDSAALRVGNRVGADTAPEVGLYFDMTNDPVPVPVSILNMLADRVAIGGAVDVTGSLSVNGTPVGGLPVDVPRGLVARFSATGNPVATAGVAETALATVPAPPGGYAAGRAYEVTVRAQVTPTATLDLYPRVRKGTGSTSGAVLLDYGRQQIPLASGGDRFYEFGGGFRTGSAAVSADLTFTAATSAGTLPFKGFGSGAFVVEVRDVGDAAKHPNLPTLV